jgi:uncharacterized membrane protein
MLLYQISVYVHILSAIVWIGGMLFLPLVIVPVTRGLPPAERAALFGAVGRRFRAVGWTCIGLLLVTGTINVSYRIAWASLFSSALWTSTFGQTLAAKLSVVAILLALSVYHDFFVGPRSVRLTQHPAASADAQRVRRQAARIGRIEAILALIVVALAVMLVRGLPF